MLVNDSLHARLSHAEEDAGDIENYERAAATLEERMKFLKKTGNRGEIAKLQEERRQVREQMEAFEIQPETGKSAPAADQAPALSLEAPHIPPDAGRETKSGIGRGS